MPRARAKPTKIGIVFGPFDTIAQNILSYLLIYQNSIQKTFEFRVLHAPDNDPFFHLLSEALSHTVAEQEIGAFVSRVHAWNEQEAEVYQLASERVDKLIVLANARFDDNFYYIGSTTWAVIALGGWEKEFSPPSIVEYFLSFASLASLDAIARPMTRHFDTRGCAFDFNAELQHARLKVLSGHICSSCARSIERLTSKQVLADAQMLLRRSWLGTASDPSDVALAVKKLGYDLFHTSGVKPTLKERVLVILEQEGLKNLLNITFQIMLAVILVLIGLKSIK
jgi:hypothetical protein